MHTFLHIVDKILKDKGKRRTWLSKQTGIALSTINSWFSKNIFPKADDALKVAQALNTSLDYLMSGKGMPAGNDPILQNIINFLKKQNHETLISIESSLTIFNYVNITQNIGNAPALMLDKNLHITWVNEKFIKIFGKKSKLIGTRLLEAPDDLPVLEYIDDDTSTIDEDTAYNKDIIPAYSKTGSFVSKNSASSPALLHNIILIPIYNSYKSHEDMDMPQGYAGIFININQQNKYAIDNIFSKLAEISLLKENSSFIKIKRIRKCIEIFSKELSGLPEYPEIDEEYIEDLIFFAPMHDIGKIGIPDDILNKQNKLEEWECELVKEHTINGAYILSAYPNTMGKEIALQHHERFDGTGYPYGLSGTTIALSARITSICITYDALITQRPYRDANTHDEVISIIEQEKGLYFDPFLVDKFLGLHEKIKDIYSDLQP
jgi:transcriptional regulator with XRE-family HTH domain